MARLNLSPKRTALVLALASLVFAAPLAGAAGKQQPDRVRVSVAFKSGNEAAMRAAITNAGGRVVFELDEVNAVAVDLPRRALAALQKSPYARFVEEDVPRHALSVTGGVAVASQVTPYGIPMVQADQVSDASAGNRTLCIVDSGIDAAHEDHQGNLLNGIDFSGSGDWNTDEAHHGTHVAGTIAAVNNSIGVIGVLPNKNLNIFIAKVFDASGSASSSTIAKAMLACRKNGNANVISMSLGGSSASKLEQAVVTFLAKRNILLIAAAGNAGTSAVSYPAGFAEVVSVAAIDSNMAHASFSQFNPDVELSGPGVSVLSTVPMGTGTDASASAGGTGYAVIAMAGSPFASATASLYNFGIGDVLDPGAAGKVCLIARGTIAFSDKVLNCQNSGGVAALIFNNVPGPLNGTLNGVVTAIPSVGADGNDSASLLSKVGQSSNVTVAQSNYALFDGTSMATPHVSAVAALVWSRHTNCTAAEIRASLNNSAFDLGNPGRDDNFGFGLVQAKAADDRIARMGCGL
jgi:subtilisin family serine protease